MLPNCQYLIKKNNEIYQINMELYSIKIFIVTYFFISSPIYLSLMFDNSNVYTSNILIYLENFKLFRLALN